MDKDIKIVTIGVGDPKPSPEALIKSEVDVVIVDSPYLGDPETINEVYELHNHIQDITDSCLPTKQELKQEKMNRIQMRRRG